MGFPIDLPSMRRGVDTNHDISNSRPMLETWKAIDGFPHYEVSDLGRVRRSAPGINTYVGKILTFGTSRGYKHVGMMRNGKVRTKSVHTLVCSAFHGMKPSSSYQVAHHDGDRSNNRADNLRWATCKENHGDRFRHGTAAQGANNGRSKITQDEASFIRQQPRKRGICPELAEKFGVSIGLIYMIRQNNSPIWNYDEA